MVSLLQAFHSKLGMHFFITPMQATCLLLFILLQLIVTIMLSEKQKLSSFSFTQFTPAAVTSSFLDANIFLSIQFLDTLDLF